MSEKVSKSMGKTKFMAKGKEAAGSSSETYDASRFLGVHEERANRKTWVQNRAIIEREIRLNAFGEFTWEKEFAD